MVFDDAVQVFHRPYAMLLGTRGNVNVFDLQFDDGDGNANRITVRDAPMIEYAAIGRLADPSRSPKFPNELVRAFLGAFLEEVPEAAFAKSDVGLGVETMVLDVDMFRQVPGNVALTIQGDLQPHYFVVDGWIVCSTSIRLSRSILAAWRDPQQRFAAPVASGNDVTAFGQMPGDTFATFVEHAVKLVADTVSGQGSVELQGPTVEIMHHVGPLGTDKLPSFGEFIRLLDRVEWRTTDSNSVRETRFRIKLAGDLLRE
jgi:hypothetical protein